MNGSNDEIKALVNLQLSAVNEYFNQPNVKTMTLRTSERFEEVSLVQDGEDVTVMLSYEKLYWFLAGMLHEKRNQNPNMYK